MPTLTPIPTVTMTGVASRNLAGGDSISSMILPYTNYILFAFGLFMILYAVRNYIIPWWKNRNSENEVLGVNRED